MPTYTDDFYLRFENAFRGSCDDIRSRQAFYLPLLDLLQSNKDLPIVDIGSGRGEWLGLLAEHGWNAYGLDTNAVMAEQCIAQGYKVLIEDVLGHFRSLPDACLTAITGFHVIEHIPFDILASWFKEAHRVLRPGGMLIFETPNSENLQMGASNFFMDPTHIRPLLPAQLGFLGQDAGFSNMAILRLHPNEELAYQQQYTDSPAMLHILNLLFGPQDFSIVAVKNDEARPDFAPTLMSVVYQLAAQLTAIPSSGDIPPEKISEKIVRLEGALERVQTEISVIKNSIMWKLTHPVSTFTQWIKPKNGT